jgi:nicotinamidase-related amidase
MSRSQVLRSLIVVAVTGGLAAAVGSVSSAQGVIGVWTSVQPPPAPQLKSISVDPRKTALLVMDFGQRICNPAQAPRCAAAMPKVKELLDKARAHHMLVLYTGFPMLGPIVKEIAPTRGEQEIIGHADKFDGTNLNGILKARGITTVIATGTVANGAVLFTAFGAASRGYKVIVPVDTMPGRTLYAEQSSIWGIANDPGLGPRVATLTSVDIMRF